jgi:hypothetical protein
VSHIPGKIPYRLGWSTTANVTNWSNQYDVSIAGIQFTAAYDANNPYMRKSAQQKKDQLDTAKDAGEQTLDFWWLRSQESFHAGAGQDYFEPAQESDDQFARIRFDTSFNMNVFEVGKLTRLPDTKVGIAFTDAPKAVLSADVDSGSFVAVAHGNKLDGVKLGSADTAVSYTWGGTATIHHACTDGVNYYITDGSFIYKGPMSNSGSGVKQWAIPGGTAGVKLAWVKERLIACCDNKVFEVVETPSSSSPPPIATVRYTHPNTAWTWTDFADAPQSILIAGKAGSNSSIYSFGLDTSDPPIISDISVVGTMPIGEMITSLNSYVGSFVGIGTTEGVRVGQFDPYYGKFSYGPLTYLNGVTGLTGRGNDFYATVTGQIEGESGLVRINLGFQVDQAGRMPWANDLVCNPALSSPASFPAPCAFGSRMAWCQQGSGLILQRFGTTSVNGRAGWLRTSKIRYSTVEPKYFRYARVRGVFDTGTLAVYATGSDNGASEQLLISRTALGPPSEFKVFTSPQEWLQLRFEFSDDTAYAMELDSYQLKSLPATNRQREIQIPVNCYDFEQDKYGVNIGYQGRAFAQIQQLELVDESGEETVLSINYGDFTEDRVCVIEDLTFQQIYNPTRTDSFGGVLMITVRTTQ